MTEFQDDVTVKVNDTTSGLKTNRFTNLSYTLSNSGLILKTRAITANLHISARLGSSVSFSVCSYARINCLSITFYRLIKLTYSTVAYINCLFRNVLENCWQLITLIWGYVCIVHSMRCCSNIPTTTTTVLRPLYRSTCVSRHLQLRTGGSCWCKVLCPHALADWLPALLVQ